MSPKAPLLVHASRVAFELPIPNPNCRIVPGVGAEMKSNNTFNDVDPANVKLWFTYGTPLNVVLLPDWRAI